MEPKLFIIFCLLIPTVLSKCTINVAQTQLSRSVYDFSVELLSRIAEENENHFVTSTFSSWTLLATISLGANGTTLTQLRTVLKLHKNKCFNHKYLNITKDISVSNSEVTVERSSAVFADEKLNIKKKFVKKLSRKELSEIKPISFEDVDKAVAVINDYVSDTTHNIIEEMVSASDLENVQMMIIDAIFFKGAWQTPFKVTDIQTFYNEKGDPVGHVTMMHLLGSVNSAYINQINSLVLELPYGNDGRYSMLIILPDDNIDIHIVIESLKKISLVTVFKQLENEYTAVAIPKFKISSDLDNLKELLIDMGLKDMFDSARASFPDISDTTALYVTSYMQKAFIEVNEEGTTASAATSAGFGSRSGPLKFTADKPFLYMVVDKKLLVPLFVGAYSKPSEI
ncbi:unnamed protein product [Leptidea sinapis]|uniref:Serpin domain-containing protein n=1 Tax=Leptidea sinapis TaxID=189913 RepID=A0A5E4QBZ0_9NEOP|nr:unnamed protein product [Leptidea sinapis]